MDAVDASGGEQPPGQFVDRAGPHGVGGRRIALVTHPGEAAIELEDGHVGTDRRFAADGDELTHDGSEQYPLGAAGAR